MTKEEQIEELVEWELASMDYTSLQEYYFKKEYRMYMDNPKDLEDMLQYKKECTDPDTVFN